MNRNVFTFHLKMLFELVSLFACVGLTFAQNDTRVVQIDQGLLRGYKDQQRGIFRFNDVPYATAPTGQNKFKAPLPAPTWNDTFDAVNRWIMCPQPQYNFTNEFLEYQEDCLVANIFVPDTNTTNLPVMVYIHGGAYLHGAGFAHQFSSLVQTERTIVVTFNYRLGIHGHLCLGTLDVPGNAGPKDQVALLRWVNRNIASFGGNPNDVTIAGCSSGGGSVEYLSISPLAAGLFNKVITESGAIFGITGPQGNPVENAKLYARQLNFTNVDDIDALEGFYKNASHEFLLSETLFLATQTYGSSIVFAPCVERNTGEEMFLADTPMNIIKNGNYSRFPLLYGFAEMEGLIRGPEFEYIKDLMNSSFSYFIPDDIQFDNDTQKEEFAERVKQFYFGNQGVSEDTILTYVDYFTDVLFAIPMLRATNLRRGSLNDTIYLYEYNYADENFPQVPFTNITGTDHCYQAYAVADEDVTNATEAYKVMKDVMRELWLNFIETGNPTPVNSTIPSGNSSFPLWPAVDGYLQPYMSLNSNSSVEQSALLEERISFWESIYETNYKQPVPPPEPTPATTASPDVTNATQVTTAAPTQAPTTAPTVAPTTAVPDSAVTSTVSLILFVIVLVINYITIY